MVYRSTHSSAALAYPTGATRWATLLGYSTGGVNVHNDGMIQGWPEELAHMLATVPVKFMPDVYYEYLLAKSGMEAMGWTWLRTDPEIFSFIREMVLDDNVYSVYLYERNDA